MTLPCESTLQADTQHSAWMQNRLIHMYWGYDYKGSYAGPIRGSTCPPEPKADDPTTSPECDGQACSGAGGPDGTGIGGGVYSIESTYADPSPPGALHWVCMFMDWYDGNHVYQNTDVEYCWQEPG